ncbi:efflux RND transporter permease subunit [Desulfovermiculus halophilus]|jgi:multidrug efflux pump subunit AcrB|uniref:efflux RND transporter permease subunit n=1 Tax=Desulfovermiculus halophilus TaxID=339722 RepID=UPI0004861CE5|nr:efflux RND transporter permease subunit [Desulfovermiculus halophilus]
MTLVDKTFEHPHLVLAVVLLGVALGLASFQRLPQNLFPEANYPSVSVLLIWPGASAEDVQSRVARYVDAELASLDQSRTVRAVSKDEVAAVSVEFEYTKGIDAAVVDVSSALDRIWSGLPDGLLPPRIFRVTDATSPAATLAVKPAGESGLDLSMTRQICDNDLREALLRIPEVSQVEVFGGRKPEIRLAVDRIKLEEYGLSLEQVTSAVAAQNANIPGGTIIRSQEQYLVSIQGEKLQAEELENIVLASDGSGEIHLRDVADISFAHQDMFSFFRGNGAEAVGMNILRPETGHISSTLASFQEHLPQVRQDFPNLELEIVDTSGDIIETSIQNMISSLRSAVILTVAVIFLLLARTRATALTVVSIPFTFLLTFAGMSLLGLELNIVTMTGIILAVGLLVDDSIVIIENIDRHYRSGAESPRRAARSGTREIYLADFSGTLTTVSVLLPIMFVGGYPQQILRPLALTLSLALIFSYLVSITVIPLLAPYLLGSSRMEDKVAMVLDWLSSRIVAPLQSFFVHVYRLGSRARWLFIPLGIVVLVLSMRQMPLAGKDLMPPMDTGIMMVEFETSPGTSVEETQKTVARMEEVIARYPGFVRMSTKGGAEPGVISFGAERTAQEGVITVHFVDRFARDKSIWEIESELRTDFARLPGLERFSVYEYGATPLSSISAPIDVQIAGPDPRVLDGLAAEAEDRLREVPGLNGISRSWDRSKEEVEITLDHRRMAAYGITVSEVSRVLAAATQGMQASELRIPGQKGIKVQVRLAADKAWSIQGLQDVTVMSDQGPIPLREVAEFQRVLTQDRFIREDLQSVVNVYGYRDTMAISHLQAGVEKALAGMGLPPGYSLSQEGEVTYMNESFSRLGQALMFSLILLYFSLVPIFRSFVQPVVIMVAIPLAFIGVSWGMLLAGKHFCMPASMGMVLLSGIVVNNSILLMDFINQARADGLARQEAIVQAIQTRTRPIVMTATSTMAGMLPIAMEMAVGLERLSPLAVVAIGGLLVSTFLTLVYVPIFYTVFDDVLRKFKRMRD